MTATGYKKIEDISIGDYVLTHNNKFEKVLHTMKKFSDNINELEIMGSSKFKATDEHPFYVKKTRRKYVDGSRSKTRVFGDPEWVDVKDLEKGHYVGIAINQMSEIPLWKGIESNVNQSTKKEVNNLDLNDRNFWWVIGRYMGDGWTSLHKRKERDNSFIYKTVICCSLDEGDELECALKKVFNYCKVKENNIYKFQITNEELYFYLQ